jgi:hypothetical protein
MALFFCETGGWGSTHVPIDKPEPSHNKIANKPPMTPVSLPPTVHFCFPFFSKIANTNNTPLVTPFFNSRDSGLPSSSTHSSVTPPHTTDHPGGLPPLPAPSLVKFFFSVSKISVFQGRFLPSSLSSFPGAHTRNPFNTLQPTFSGSLTTAGLYMSMRSPSNHCSAMRVKRYECSPTICRLPWPHGRRKQPTMSLTTTAPAAAKPAWGVSIGHDWAVQQRGLSGAAL